MKKKSPSKRLYSNLVLNSFKEDNEHHNISNESGVYISLDGYAVVIYMNSYQSKTQDRNEQYSSLNVIHEGKMYEATYNRVFTHRGLCLVASKMIKEVLNGE